MSLSGGQKQRISIARDVLKNAEILIFDDSTSALDLKTEANLYDALKETRPESTKIIIAQRIASVRRADRIAVLRSGTLEACGTHERMLVIGMFFVVIFGTLCGIYAPSLQSRAIDMIVGTREGSLVHTLFLMVLVCLFYSGSQLFQGLLSADLSQRIVKRMREELFGKIVDLPVRYLDTHSHGDVMSRMTNDIENISTTISQSLPSLFFRCSDRSRHGSDYKDFDSG